MRKITFVAFILALLLPAFAHAAGAYKISATMNIGFGPEFMEMMKSQMGEGAEGMTAEDMAAFMPETMQMSALIYTTGNKMRMEMGMGDFGSSIMIYDYDSSISYMLDPASKTAMKMDLSAYQDASMAMGMPSMSPEEIVGNVDKYIEAIKGIEGFDVQELGKKEILGRACRGISFTGDLAKVMAAMNTADTTGMPALPQMSGTYKGTVWVADEVGMPMEMDMEMMGMTYGWRTTSVDNWTVDPSMFNVPAGYEVTDMSDMMMPQSVEAEG